MTIKARFDGQSFVPDGRVDLPIGSVVEVILPAVPHALDLLAGGRPH